MVHPFKVINTILGYVLRLIFWNLKLVDSLVDKCPLYWVIPINPVKLLNKYEIGHYFSYSNPHIPINLNELNLDSTLVTI